MDVSNVDEVAQNTSKLISEESVNTAEDIEVITNIIESIVSVGLNASSGKVRRLL